MNLPWNRKNEEKIQELEKKIEDLKTGKEKLQSRYDAEKNRRSKLSRKKQDAEEELNRLKDKLDGLKGKKNNEKSEEKEGVEEISFEHGHSFLKKLSTIRDEREEFVTVYCPGNFGEFDRRKDLMNSIGKNTYNEIASRKSFAAFMGEDLSNWLLETRPFFGEKMVISEKFAVSEFLEFVEKEKFWVLLSAGDTKVFREESGDFEEIEHLNSRIEKKHSKGGFSQGRFERKRDEQISQYMDEVKDFLEGLEGDVFLLGDKRFCEKVPGKRLGGFDPNRGKPEQFYGFRLLNF